MGSKSHRCNSLVSLGPCEGGSLPLRASFTITYKVFNPLLSQIKPGRFQGPDGNGACRCEASPERR
jgi:hypothetical protein